MERLTLMHDTHGKIGLIRSYKNLVSKAVSDLERDNNKEQIALIQSWLTNLDGRCKDLVII